MARRTAVPASAPHPVLQAVGRRVRPLSLFGITLIYAVCFAVIKAGLAFAPPLRFAALRAITGGAALLVVVAVRREPLLPARSMWGHVLALGLVATSLTYGAMFLSPGRAGAGLASVLGNLQPLFTLGLAAGFLGERLTRAKVVALALGLAGVSLMAFPPGAGAGTFDPWGGLLALTASAASAAGNLMAKRMDFGHSLLAITAWQLFAGGVPLLALSAVLERGQGVSWTAEFLALLLFLGLAGTAFLTAAWFWLIHRDDVGRLSLFFLLVPVFGLAIGALAFGEGVSVWAAAGAALTLIGMGRLAWKTIGPDVDRSARTDV